MALIDLLRPRWRHTDPAVRRTAVAALTEEDGAILQRLAREDASSQVRLAAIGKLADPVALGRLLEGPLGIEEHRAAVERLVTISSRGGPSSLTALATRLSGGGRGAVEEGSSPEDCDRALRSALQDLQDPQALARLALGSGDPKMRQWAVARVSDPEVLREVAIGETTPAIALDAVGRISGEPALRKVASLARCEEVQKAAERRLSAPHSDRSQKRRERRNSRRLAS
ncbi:MAG: HEAT repeat domain-containing protein [Myxococcales bacterium]|nr:HEAT repeat domain-containing protein [Myxococcales bacterium]